jgi:hypothetical protein
MESIALGANEADRVQRDIYRRMTPRQRLARAFALSAMMRQILASGFRKRNPDWTDQEVARAVADRILHADTR